MDPEPPAGERSGSLRGSQALLGSLRLRKHRLCASPHLRICARATSDEPSGSSPADRWLRAAAVQVRAKKCHNLFLQEPHFDADACFA